MLPISATVSPHGLAPLRQFYSASRHDHYLVSSDLAATTAVASGYVEVWHEGWTASSGYMPNTWAPWPNMTSPSDGGTMPFAPSPVLSALVLDWGSATGNMLVTGADTFFPSWGADDRLYTPYADGRARTSVDASAHSNTGWVAACCDERNKQACGLVAHQGYAVFSGADPLNQTADKVGVFNASAAPFYQGRCVNFTRKCS